MKLFLEIEIEGDGVVSLAAIQDLFESTAAGIAKKNVGGLQLGDSPTAPRTVILTSVVVDKATGKTVKGELTNKVAA